MSVAHLPFYGSKLMLCYLLPLAVVIRALGYPLVVSFYSVCILASVNSPAVFSAFGALIHHRALLEAMGYYLLCVPCMSIQHTHFVSSGKILKIQINFLKQAEVWVFF